MNSETVMTTKLDTLRAAEARLLLPTYERNPVVFVSGKRRLYRG